MMYITCVDPKRALIQNLCHQTDGIKTFAQRKNSTNRKCVRKNLVQFHHKSILLNLNIL